MNFGITAAELAETFTQIARAARGEFSADTNTGIYRVEVGTRIRYAGGLIPRRSFMEIGEGGPEAVMPIGRSQFIKCAYCGSGYGNFQTNCDNCGAPLSEPPEVLHYLNNDTGEYMEFPL